ncbi:hypothetical protein GGI00_004550 [Coemansia sp. RSA 2681]|nr:hypothetical protein GGI00_004550 [Coemansia sp. RSA 2681]
MALRQLWFLLTRPVNSIGFVGTSVYDFEYLHIDTCTCPATFEVVLTEDKANAEVKGLIQQQMPIVGRCAHLFRVLHGTKPAVLKLAWTRRNRLSEGAVYEVLSTKDGDGNMPVCGIPHIYASGILAKNVDGYRLEFLVMEDCGEPIVGYFAKLRETKMPADKFAQAVKCCVESVMQTLVEARHVSVLHRDISAGNIAIKNGRAYVIDWGYAKLLCPPNEPLNTATATRLEEGGSYKDGFAKRWEMDWDEVIATETAKDPFTGTSLYMSIQVLLQAPQRSIFNDLESLFYVVLDALSERDRTDKKKSTPGFAFFSSESMALMRIAILLGEQGYLSDFGVDVAASPILADMLAAMYKFLFYEGDRYIGGKLRDNYQRQFDPTEAGGFMNAKTLTLFNGSNELVKETPNSPQNTEALGAVDSNSGGDDENVAPMHNVANMPYTPTARGTRSKSGARPPGPNTPWAPVPFPPVATASDKKRAQNEESIDSTEQSPKRRKSSDHMDVVDGTDEPSDSN